MLNLYPDNLQTNIILPLGPNRTLTRFEWYVLEPNSPGVAEEFARDSKYGIWFWEAHIYRSLAANCAAKADFAEAISRLSAEDGSEPNRHVIEVPDKFAIARWSREADIGEIARCILGTLKYEPHAVDTTVLRDALEGVIERAKEDAA